MNNPAPNSEEALLGACMRDGSKYAQARELVTADQFENHAYGFAWQAMEHLHEQGMGIDTVTLGDELERMGKMSDFSHGQWSGRALLSSLRENGDPRNVITYAELVQDMAVKRGMDLFFTKCVGWSKNGRRAKAIMSDVTTELSKITLYSSQDEYTVPIGTAVSEAYDLTDAASNNLVVGVPTGFMDLDRILGSLYAGNVYLIAARTGQGKTGMLLSIARNAAKIGKRVAIFSLEMSRSQVAQRLISMESQVALDKITRGRMEDSEWPMYTHGVEVVAGLPIVINDLSSININEIRQTARKIKADGGLDLVLVDYVQLADSGKKKNERRELDVSEVSRGLKYLARELDVPVLAAAQLSRAVEQRAEKRPILSDLRESGSLEQDAYSVMFIYRPDQYEKDTAKQNTAEIIVAKHRNGPVGSCELIFRPTFARFEDAASKTFRFGENQ